MLEYDKEKFEAEINEKVNKRILETLYKFGRVEMGDVYNFLIEELGFNTVPRYVSWYYNPIEEESE